MSFSSLSTRRYAAGVPVLVATASVGLLTSASADATTAAGTTLSANWSATSVVVDRALSVSGQVTSGTSDARPVQLLQKLPEGWSVLAEQTTTADGSYTFEVPTSWYNQHRLVVSAPATSDAQAARSVETDVTVLPAYTPQGSASNWNWLSKDYRYRWNPCREISYRVNATKATAGAVADTKEAFRRLARATGLRFRYLGSTSAIPGTERAWPADTSFLVAWANPSQTSVDLSGSVIGYGAVGSAWSARDSNGAVAEIARAEVTIDATAKLASGFGRSYLRTTRGSILMHELAHASGLGHTNRSKQIMMPSTDRSITARWGAGDLTGLHHIGRAQGCML